MKILCFLSLPFPKIEIRILDVPSYEKKWKGFSKFRNSPKVVKQIWKKVLFHSVYQKKLKKVVSSQKKADKGNSKMSLSRNPLSSFGKQINQKRGAGNERENFEKEFFLGRLEMSFFSEGGGFEPPVVSQLRRFSKPVHSTALPPFPFSSFIQFKNSAIFLV